MRGLSPGMGRTLVWVASVQVSGLIFHYKAWLLHCIVSLGSFIVGAVLVMASKGVDAM